MKSDHWIKPGSAFQLGSVASLRAAEDRTPLEFSRPAGLSTPPTEMDVLLRTCVGDQPISATLVIACAANLGVVTLKKMSAPELFRVMICEFTVASVVS